MPDLYREPTDSSTEAPGAAASLNSVEMEIAELEKQIAQKRALISGVEKERSLEQVIGAEKPAILASTPVAAAPVAPVGATGATTKPEAEDFRGLEKNQQLKNLVDLAFQKGIFYATDVARDLDNPYLMDEFHDTLIDRLHKELVKRGKLEEI